MTDEGDGTPERGGHSAIKLPELAVRGRSVFGSQRKILKLFVLKYKLHFKSIKEPL